MTNKKIEDFESNLIIEKLTLKNMDIPKFNMQDMIKKLNQEYMIVHLTNWWMKYLKITLICQLILLRLLLNVIFPLKWIVNMMSRQCLIK